MSPACEIPRAHRAFAFDFDLATLLKEEVVLEPNSNRV
jgi:hypothetical protein